MSVPAFGYIFASRGPELAADFGPDDRAGQCAIVESYADRHNLALDAIFVENAVFVRDPWLARPAGSELVGVLVPGCHIIVADAAVVYTSAADLLSIIQSFQARGIVLHFARFQLPGNERTSLSTADEAMSEALTTALTAICSFSRLRGEAIAAGMRRKKEEGRRYCRDAAGYGFKWKRGKRVPDETEQAVIAKIVEWREKIGCSWYEIAAHLLHCGVTVASTGREWSPSRVRRAYLAELQRRVIVGCPTI
jgi:hypothetical protein